MPPHRYSSPSRLSPASAPRSTPRLTPAVASGVTSWSAWFFQLQTRLASCNMPEPPHRHSALPHLVRRGALGLREDVLEAQRPKMLLPPALIIVGSGSDVGADAGGGQVRCQIRGGPE